ncbi:concanavalin A-like lectin/glucanase [Basidiobolus meristosporus CBS 931.73]|uniref:Concanavalin A-like lectin/glucanase n=1 Tax=Basidiobolus meristosporus CBS 931.73 TaxID=1314790 RepID=A0A1Y1YI74_9FUNG|nr:concanavalin A-like lectin/glucanase [Basidiobolus meristosporus CBS 931.73]|eukprot:ORX97712.1 concanavalin A-like lectin/glucanase [Basidiobolus meristosporus CBS 931.73]
MSFKKLFAAVGILAIGTTQISAICENFKANCPAEAPCCKDGWCSNDSLFCAPQNCRPQDSFSPQSCYPRALCVNALHEFDNPKIAGTNFTGDPAVADWTSDFTPSNVRAENGQLVLFMPLDSKVNSFGNTQGFGATVSAVRWFDYGKVSARVKSASTSKGVVSSFIVRNFEGDEIDFEWVGGYPTRVESNYYYGNDHDFSNGEKHEVGANTAEDFHTYAIEWQPDYITWSVDDKVVRTVDKARTLNATTNAYLYPQRMARIQLGIWDGGRGSEGTKEWAGGETDWSDPNRVYSMYVDWVKIECKYGGNETVAWTTPTQSTKATAVTTLGTGSPQPTNNNPGDSLNNHNNDKSTTAGKSSGSLLYAGSLPLILAAGVARILN